ncbi:MAG: tRNA (adenosine(37)-N6)-threonylcarbamoyltransferase complex dimerization subunit type 1 TsaB [Candidatus Gastranaerophilales bacterium]
MLTLGFDTCLNKMYVALKNDETILANEVVETTDTKYHSAFLISTIQKVLSQNNYKPENIDLIAVNIGPGSFTGIRACVTVARVMAQQLNIKAIGVSSLEILAKINNSEKPTLVALDARKNSAYLFAEDTIQGAVLLEDIQDKISKNDYFIISDDKIKPILGGISYQDCDKDLGKYLLEIAIEKSLNDDCDWRKLKPLYIQPPPVS